MPSQGFFLRHISNLELSHVEVASIAPDPRPLLLPPRRHPRRLHRRHRTNRARRIQSQQSHRPPHPPVAAPHPTPISPAPTVKFSNCADVSVFSSPTLTHIDTSASRGTTWSYTVSRNGQTYGPATPLKTSSATQPPATSFHPTWRKAMRCPTGSLSHKYSEPRPHPLRNASLPTAHRSHLPRSPKS